MISMHPPAALGRKAPNAAPESCRSAECPMRCRSCTPSGHTRASAFGGIRSQPRHLTVTYGQCPSTPATPTWPNADRPRSRVSWSQSFATSHVRPFQVPTRWALNFPHRGPIRSHPQAWSQMRAIPRAAGSVVRQGPLPATRHHRAVYASPVLPVSVQSQLSPV